MNPFRGAPMAPGVARATGGVKMGGSRAKSAAAEEAAAAAELENERSFLELKYRPWNCRTREPLANLVTTMVLLTQGSNRKWKVHHESLIIRRTSTEPTHFCSQSILSQLQ